MTGHALDSLEGLASSILEETCRRGSTVELFLKRTYWEQTIHQEGIRRTQSSGIETGCAIRILHPNGRYLFHHTSDPDPVRIRRAIETAAEVPAVARPAVFDPNCLPTEPVGPAGRKPDHSPPFPLGGDEFLRMAEESARRAEQSIGSVPLAMCTDGETEIWLGNSMGLRGSYRRTLRHVVLGLTCRDGGGVRYHRAATALPGRLSPERIGREAAQRSAWPFRQPARSRGRVRLLLSPPAAAEWVRLLAPRWRREFRVGDRIGPDSFDLMDDGTFPGGILTAPFDGEGWPTERRILVSRGVVRERIPAGKVKGNQIRDSFRHPPRTHFTNHFLAPGRLRTEELFREASGGILVLNLRPSIPSGIGGENGDLEISGCAVERGAPAGGIRSAHLKGGRDKIIAAIVERGTDLRFYPLDGSFGSPSLLLEGMELTS